MSNHNTSTLSQALIPIFKGKKYHLWSIKMSTLFKSQELWELVENGFPDPKPAEPDQALRDNRKKDAKALFFIQSALDDDIFPCIASSNTSNQAWEILKQEFLGDRKVITVKLQTLCQEFETLKMKDNESVQDYLSRVFGIVNQMKSYGENVTDEITISKVLRSLSSNFDHVVAAIEESKDLLVYTFDELMSYLIMEVEVEDGEEEDSMDEVVVEVEAMKPGHKESEYWFKPKDEQHASFVEKKNEETLFMTHIRDGSVPADFWFIDSGCSSHMCRSSSLFVDLDTLEKSTVRLGDDRQVHIKGKGSIAFNTTTVG
ncbi:retrovirus-related pol polyprotein from transposon TNT 1-94 [Tanacetum coccineum]